jgi:hypothetical protein
MVSDTVAGSAVLTIIRGGDGWSTYSQRRYADSTVVAADDIISALANGDDLPGEPITPRAREKSPERNLDLDAQGDGWQIYYFLLNAQDEDGKSRLEFRKPPFIFLPLNSSWEQDFLRKPTFYTPQFASFECNVGGARTSTLAANVARQARGHRRCLNIPFLFNWYDPVLKAAPWLVSSEPAEAQQSGVRSRIDDRSGSETQIHSHLGHDHDHHGEDGHAHGQGARTHGGVHPAAASFLSVDVPEELWNTAQARG